MFNEVLVLSLEKEVPNHFPGARSNFIDDQLPRALFLPSLGLHGVQKPGQESSDSHPIHHLVDGGSTIFH